MRDPKRIPDVLAALGTYWANNQDLRLGQIIVNMCPANNSDPFYTEDKIILKSLQEANEKNVS